MLPNTSFHLIGVSHHMASLEEREPFAFTPAETAVLLEDQLKAGRSSLLLSTCNRCELYWAGDEDLEPWFRRVAKGRGAASSLQLIRYDGLEAVRHLFRVTAGLDSQILGETEVLGQVRRAFDAARAAGTTTREMDQILSAALAAGRRVRCETFLGRHPASVSSAAVDVIAERWGKIGSREVVVLGAGEAAEGALRALHELGASRVILLSRRPGRTQVLAEAWGAASGTWEELAPKLETADLLLVATGGSRPVVSAAQLSQAVATRPDRDLFVMDLSVPRNVDPAAREIAGVQLFDLDDLQRLCCPAAGAASIALDDAHQVIEDELARLGVTLRGKVVAGKLADLHRLGVELAEQESAWALARLESLSESDREVVREMADRLVRRVLYPVSRDLRQNESGAGSHDLPG
ncbi:MAG TPA: glutamyl-tRNA reductase [Gemmatimonadales bacterium]|nr:glutamyl-tRNA reductase [Gemmatimonadales bacterium]